MLVADRLIYGDPATALTFSEIEHPVVAQIAGSDPERVAEAAVLVQKYGFDAINLNIGCPSKRVQSAGFGACQMAQPEQVANIATAIKEAVDIPLSIKCRLGTDRINGIDALANFVQTTSSTGVNEFIVHSRIAVLSYSTRANLSVPPLQYELVQKLQENFPQLQFTLNGGLSTVEDVQRALDWIDRVMLGRAVLKRPMLLAELDLARGRIEAMPSQAEIAKRYLLYIQEQWSHTRRHQTLIRPLLNLFSGLRGARHFRQLLSSAIGQKTLSYSQFTDSLMKASIGSTLYA